MLSERRRRVLQAVVDEYVSSAIPVGSRTLVERYQLGCSSATVRAELSALEECGQLAQPHVSAGRIPTDAGYRSVVDEFLAKESSGESEFKDSFGRTNRSRLTEIDELMRATSGALSQYTNCLALAVAPSISSATVVRLNLLSLAPQKALFVLITDSGQVLNRTIDLKHSTAPEELAAVERALNAALGNKRASTIAPLRQALSQQDTVDCQVQSSYDSTLLVVIDEILDALTEADSKRLSHKGMTGLLAQPEFHESDRLAALIKLVDDGLGMLDMMADAFDGHAVTVRIGSENSHNEMGSVSVVLSPYSVAGSAGLVGVVGPTRMDYHRTISAVSGAASVLSHLMETSND